METIIQDKDIKVFYIQATSFPEGALPAHEKLHTIVPFSKERKYFGISRPENNMDIVYKAATEETFHGEAEQYDCKTLILKKGKYISMIVKNYTADIASIGKAFDKLLKQPDLDPQGYCVEWYLSEKDVQCMVRLKQ